MKWEPKDYQLKATKFLVERANAGLFLHPGLGKTSSTLAAFSYLKKKKIARRALVIAPLRVALNVWGDECRKWEDFHDLKVQSLHGAKKEKQLKIAADIYTINPEGLHWLLGGERNQDDRLIVQPSRLISLGIDTLIVDELTKFKKYNTQRFKMMRQILGRFRRRWGLTGTPIPNGYLDLFGQLYVIDEGAAIGRYITHYRRQYFLQGFNGYTWTLKEGARDQIHKRIAPIVMRMTEEEYLKLPPLVVSHIEVELGKKTSKVYDQLFKLFVAELKSGVVVASNVADRILKCRQVTGGAIYQEAEGKRTTIHGVNAYEELGQEKIEALQELIEELQGDPLLLAYEFRHEADRIKRHIKGAIDVADIKASDFGKVCDEWREGKIPVLMGHPASIGHGLNLQGACRHIAFFSPTWNYELQEQFIRRVRRQGAEHHAAIFLHNIIAKKTIDRVVLAALEKKEDTQRELFAGLKRIADGGDNET